MAYVKKIWKDYPDTTTPITKEDLNNIEDGIEAIDTRLNGGEMYVQATAGANGDFFVNLTNQTLVNGRIVKISFPSATNSSANARLSIDGGTTYKNIKLLRGATTIPAHLIQSQNLALKYDGTNFIAETNLIAYGILDDSGTLTINNLNIVDDGGVYDIVFQGIATGGDNGVISVGGLGSNYNISVVDISGSLTANGTLNGTFTYNQAAASWRLCAVINGTYAYANASLILNNNTLLYETKGGHSYNGRQRYISGEGNYTGSVSNVNSLLFSGSLTTGTNVKIYKRGY